MHNQMRHPSPNRSFVLSLLFTALLGCGSRVPSTVGDNVGQTAQPLAVDKVDILLVVDDSASMADFQRAELPRLVQAFVSGHDAEVGHLPEITNVHVAVTSTNMGVGQELWAAGEPPQQCQGRGNDGIFIRFDGEDVESCMAEYRKYVSLENGTAALVTAESIACLPAPDAVGCGFEQPLEAALKALWPASDPSLEFLYGSGHGTDANAGFLRDDSLLIVVVISDEDDCSAEDLRLFKPAHVLDPNDPIAAQSLNARCALSRDLLFERERYVDGLKALRPSNENVVFVAIAGIPLDLLEGGHAGSDFSDDAERDAYFDAILADPRMQERIVERPEGNQIIEGSCSKRSDGGFARPPRRLVEVGKDFGEYGVLGSICNEDYGAVTGRILRAAVERIEP